MKQNRIFLTPSHCFYTLLFLHVLCWTLVPTWARFVLPMDAMEGAMWGQQFELGYDKDPLLNAWLTRFAIVIGGGADWLVYLFSQLSVAICFWAIWQLGKKIVSPWYAFIGVLLLEGMQYFHLAAIDFNDNVLQLPTWGLTLLCFYIAIKKQRMTAWLGVGLFTGLAFLAKYYAVMLFVPMLVFLCVDKDARRSFSFPGLYAGAFLSLLVVLPHLVWSVQNDFLTLHYSLGRPGAPVTWIDHLYHPFAFVLSIGVAFIIPLLLFGLLFLRSKSSEVLVSAGPIVSRFDRSFLLYLGLGPFAMNILLAVIFGLHLHPLWAMPVVSLWGLMLVAFKPPSISKLGLYRLFGVLGSLIFILLISYFVSMARAGDTSSANFPGREIAKQLTEEWRARYNTPLKYVAGQRWTAGNVANYSPDHPLVYIDWNPKISTWIDEAKLRKQGAVFVWSVKEDGPDLLPALRARFPNVELVSVQRYPWKRDSSIPPVEIGVAFLPPNP